jgi:hypothetical protein
MKREALAPCIASGVLLGTTIAFGAKRFGLAGLCDLATDTTRRIVNLVAVPAAVGFSVGSLSYTSVGGAFSRELPQSVGDDIRCSCCWGR